MHVAERVADAIANPMLLGGHDAVMTASIGVAFSGEHSKAEDVLTDADLAMYRAKERGRARIELFDHAMRERTVARLETEHALRRAMQQGELRLHYQPIVALATGEVVACEALLRWQHPERGLVPPVEFISVAEDTGMIVPIGAWVLDEACRQLAAWRADEATCGSLRMSVNLSARQFGDPGLVGTVAGALARAEIEPGDLWLEITESVLMEEADATVETLRALKRLGVRIAVDDFGTGYSSLSYLKRFPVDELKIDRSFVDGLGHDSEDQAIATAVVGLGRALGLGVLAEGVETQAQLNEVRRLGCNSVQGYFLGRPQAPEDLPAAILEAQRRREPTVDAPRRLKQRTG
jgi:EAL domain-containing protein (putative c-di-GMP-specific phosphodiesterase class I)